MKEILKLTMTLAAVALFCSGILAYVYTVTKEPIAKTAEAGRIAAVSSVVPEGCTTIDCKKHGDFEYYLAVCDGKPVAYAFEGVSHNGYGGDVRLMVGIGADGKLVNFEVLQSAETPGLGSKMADDSFRAPLRGRSVDGKWKVKKDGGDIDAITAATISSRACAECIRDAIGKFRKVCPR